MKNFETLDQERAIIAKQYAEAIKTKNKALQKELMPKLAQLDIKISKKLKTTTDKLIVAASAIIGLAYVVVSIMRIFN